MADGLTSDGFGLKTLADIKSDLATDQLSRISGELNTESTSMLGVLNAIFAERLYTLWELAQAVYNSYNPDSAEGVSLDNISALTGLTRLPSTQSTGTITLTGTVSAVISAGVIVATSVTGEQFTTDEDATIGGGGTVDVGITSVNYGEIQGLAGTITEIIDGPSTLDSVTNAGDVTLGRELETDAELRVRREGALAVAGASTVDAIVADLLLVSGVTEAVVLENVTDAEDGNGLPPKSFEAIVLGGAAADVAESIWSNKPAGILAHGDLTETVTDTQGYDHEIGFTRPTEKDIYVEITLTGGDNYEGDIAVQNAILAYGATLGVSDDVVYWKVGESVGDLDIADVTDLQIGVDAASGTSNITIDTFEVSNWDSTWITVNSS